MLKAFSSELSCSRVFSLEYRVFRFRKGLRALWGFRVTSRLRKRLKYSFFSMKVLRILSEDLLHDLMERLGLINEHFWIVLSLILFSSDMLFLINIII